MKKLIILGLVGAIALTGCSMNPTVTYEKKSQTIEALEDKIEAQLAVENPGNTYDVDINRSTKSKKKKKR